MGSRAQVITGALLLSAASAGAVAALESPRGLVLAALLALVGVISLGVALRRKPAPIAVLPEFAGSDAAALNRSLALQDALLEQLPVALWKQQQGRVEPLNARARRLLAPGGALLDAAQLLARADGELLSLATERGDERWLLSSNLVTVAGEETRLLAMLPVESELEAENMRAWRQLVHVLTHEIMNSLTPIASLSRTAQELVKEEGAEQDLTLALETITRRAESLAGFVGNYRRVSELPAPQPEPVLLAELFARLERLAAWRGQARYMVEPATLSLMADPGQLEQALLNLIKNAAEATADLAAPQLDVSARLLRGGRLAIEVRDNGPGVPEGLAGDIFLPFFSTRPGQGGRGIGLSVVRNLVHGMGGTVRHVKPVRGGAAFVLSF